MAQWADLPDYARLLDGGLKFKVPPRLISGTPPNPPDFLAPGKTASVKVAVAIDERGNVAAARVYRSDDPRLDTLAVTAIQAWKFAPAEDAIGPVKALVQLPLEFEGPPPEEQNTIAVNLGPFDYDARRRELSALVLLTGPAVGGVKSARVRLAQAIDDTGTDLCPSTEIFDFPAPVASTAKRTPTTMPPVGISLLLPGPGAKELRSLEGAVEAVIPALDPAATVQVDELPAKLGRPVTSPALAAANITVIVLDRAACVQALGDASDPGGVRRFLADTRTGVKSSKQDPTGINRMTDRDVALAIDDPEGRLAGVEFQTMYGSALPYNRNGWSHFRASHSKRFSIYRLNAKLTDGVKLVCWLATPESLTILPLTLAHIPLPAVPGP